MVLIRSILIMYFMLHCVVPEDDHDEHDHSDHGHDEDLHIHDEHDHDHDDHESLVKKCEEDGGKYCFSPDDNLENDCFISKDEEYCNCIESGLTDKTGDESMKNPNDITWNESKKECQSFNRKLCSKYKTSYAYYRGNCFTNVTCDGASTTDAPLSWILSGEQASCEYVQDRCAKVDNAKWNDSTKKCECLEEGAEFHGNHCHSKGETVSAAAKWGYGIIACAIISGFAVIGVMVVMLRHQWWYDYLLATMVALAMGCLLSDATLHLIPLALGLHVHDEEDGHAHAHEHAHEEEKMSGTEIRNLTIAITVGVYMFLLFEKAIHMVMPHHSHGGELEVHVNPAADKEMKEMNGHSHNKKEDVVIGKRGICEVDSVAWMVIIGDALHNFADGLVMGAAFTNSLATGLGTSIAVLCHEIPHELGDFAVLLNAGMKIKFAVLFNLLSALTCFLGLFVGLAIGSNDTAQKWIFAFTAGMFIYIACSDLIPEMNRNAAASKKPLLCFVLQQIGVFLGFLVMYLIALFEGDLESIGGGGHSH
ncbi:hypothetical protein ACHWQZ_G016712 [Mnemiopsis leidyi]